MRIPGGYLPSDPSLSSLPSDTSIASLPGILFLLGESTKKNFITIEITR